MRFGASRVLAFVTFALASLLAGNARAVGTRTFDLDSLDKLSGGDLQGVAVGSDGVVRAGFTLGSVALPQGAGTTATCAVVVGDGSVAIGTGPSEGGKIVRVTGDRATVLADTKENAVNALAVDNAGNLYAATTSNRIYRVSQGKAEVFATLPEVDSVLSLAFDKSNTLFAGTGSNGTVVRVAPGGGSTVYFKTDDPFVVSLAAGDDGVIYAGTSGKGLLYRITAVGRATVLYDLPGEDVRALAVGPNRTLYAIADEEPAGTAGESGENAGHHANIGGRAVAGPTPTPRSKPGKGSLWRFDAEGRPERMMHHDEFHYLSLALDERGTPYVGAGAEGRAYTVDDAHTVSLVVDTGERQITAISVAGRAHFVLGSDPATFHRILSVGGADAIWTSKPLDAGLRARFGHVSWRGTGAIEVSTRTGDTPAPDTTWSPWSQAIAPGGLAPSPSGRFVQVRARLKDAAATIADVRIAFVTENLRAVITEVGAREGHEKSAAKEGIPPSGGEPPKHDPVIHVAWKVDNPDNDELRYRVDFRHEGQGRWIAATSPDDILTKPELDWDTAALSEGKYRLRVDASDELANPPADATHHTLVSAPVLVDNTPPVFKSLEITGRRLRAELVDGVGPIARVEVAIDGRTEWRPLSPADGIFDTADELVDADISLLVAPGSGPHDVSVRAFDAAGNAVVREIEAP